MLRLTLDVADVVVGASFSSSDSSSLDVSSSEDDSDDDESFDIDWLVLFGVGDFTSGLAFDSGSGDNLNCNGDGDFFGGVGFKLSYDDKLSDSADFLDDDFDNEGDVSISEDFLEGDFTDFVEGDNGFDVFLVSSFSIDFFVGDFINFRAAGAESSLSEDFLVGDFISFPAPDVVLFLTSGSFDVKFTTATDFTLSVSVFLTISLTGDAALGGFDTTVTSWVLTGSSTGSSRLMDLVVSYRDGYETETDDSLRLSPPYLEYLDVDA